MVKKKPTPRRDEERARRVEELVKRAKSQLKAGRMPEIDAVVPKEALQDDYTADDYLKLCASVVLFGTHSWYIGRIDLPPETKVEWDGLRCRDVWMEFNGKVSHPDVDSIIGELQDCMGVAVAAAIAAGLVNLAAAAAAFKEALIACLISKGVEITKDFAAWIDAKTEKGSWHYCF
ncbi:hypothetical protein ABIC94_002129 [Variovorax paradoxus]|uniref:hypothetical protein n=1 Tax=Variovorax paradoxus TaxID=34073 RepID=UPI003397D44B